MKHKRSRAWAGDPGDRGGNMPADTGAAKITTAAPVIQLPTRRTDWQRLVQALRSPEDEARLELHRAAWQASVDGRAA